MKYREEKDTMGTVRVPEEAYYGAQTQRAAENFTISGLTLPSSFIKALGLIKKHAARINRDLGHRVFDLDHVGRVALFGGAQCALEYVGVAVGGAVGP